MLVEDFLEFDRKELTFNRLIFRYYKPWWKIFSLGLTIFGFALVGIALVIKVSTWLTAAIFIGGCVIGYVGIRYSHAQTRKVIKKQYSRMLNKHEQWDYKTVAKIRVDKMRAWVDKDITDYKLQTVLTAVQRKSLAPRYKFVSGHLMWSIMTLLAAAYIAVLFQSNSTTENATTENINAGFRTLSGIGIALLGIIFSFELMVIKELWQWNTNKYERLIRTLENYLLSIEKK